VAWPQRCGIVTITTPSTGSGHRHGQNPVRGAGHLHEHSTRELVELARSDSLLEASIGLAAINALLDVDEDACVEMNADEGLIRLCRPGVFVLVLGPTTPLSPVLFDYGANVISGTLVTDPETVLRYISQGASFRQVKRGKSVKLLTLAKRAFQK